MKPAWNEFFWIIVWSDVITIPCLTSERLKWVNLSHEILYLTSEICCIMNGPEEWSNLKNVVMCILFFWYWSCFSMMHYKELCYATDILEIIAVSVFKGKLSQCAVMVNWLIFIRCLVWILATKLIIMIEGFCGILQSQAKVR